MYAFKKQENKSKNFTYKLKSFYINKNYANAFSQNLKSNIHLKELKLTRNQLNDDSFLKILQNLPFSIKKLDVSYNTSLTAKSYSQVQNVLESEDYALEVLSLEGN